MKAKMKSKALAILMSLAMVFTMMPIMGAPVYADDPAPAAPGIALGPDVLSVGSNTSGAATVHMADKTWRVIGYAGEGVASTKKDPEKPGSADTMTLISAGNIKDRVRFRRHLQATDVNHYSKSNLKAEVEAVANTFSDGEKEGIATRDLVSGDYNGSDTDCIAGDEVKGALLWPLSIKEAETMNSHLRKANPDDPEQNNNIWWLRSPADYDNEVAVVDGVGAVLHGGSGVDSTYGVRPAFNVNLESVIFTSAAAGGKSDTVGLLSEVGTNDSSEWKLTIKDNAHESFRVIEVMQTAGTKIFTIQYGEAAADGKTEYISAVIKSKDNRIKYYGKITKAVAGDKRECKIYIGGIAMEGGDTLCVFNEQCNGTNKTDYASKLTEVYTEPTPPTIITQPNNLELTYGDTTGNTLEVAAEAEEGYTLSYQWYYKEAEDAEAVILINETGTSYTVPTDQNADTTKYYYCEVTATRKGDGAKATTISNLASVTINKAKLTIRPKDQTFTYNGKLQGPGDIVYEDPAEIAKYVAADGLKYNDALTNITIDGQGKDVGEYPLTITGCMINADNGKGEDVKNNYEITYEDGILHITKKPDPKPPTPKPKTTVSGTPLVRMIHNGDTGLTVTWNKIQGADGYSIYFAYCGETSKFVKTIKGNKTFAWTKSGLKKGRCYKAYVKAYVVKNGKKYYVKCSPLVHAYASGGSNEYTSAKAVTVEKASATLKAGQVFQIKPSIVKLKENKYLMPTKFAPTFRYMSSNEKVATVSSGGKVTAKGKGSCNIYVYAHNGVSRQVKVTVK